MQTVNSCQYFCVLLQAHYENCDFCPAALLDWLSLVKLNGENVILLALNK